MVAGTTSLFSSPAVAEPADAEAWSGQGASFTSTERLDGTFANPITGSDVPDVSTIRVSAEDADEPRDVYYMVSTTMELTPGTPILKSYDLVNWEIATYAWGILSTADDSALRNGRSSYGQGQWASTIAFHDGTYYVIHNSNNTGRSYLFTTDDIEDGEWTRHVYPAADRFHDPNLYFDGDTPYVFYGSNKTDAVRLSPDLKTVEERIPNVITKENFVNESGYTRDEVAPNGWEGFQLTKVGDWYYALAISFGKFGRQTNVFRSRSLLGAAVGDPYAGKIAVGTKAIAQGNLVSTEEGERPDWALVFADDFPTGRIPVLVPVGWSGPDAWPSFGDGVAGESTQVEFPGDLAMPVDLPAPDRRLAMTSSVVTSDDFANDAEHREWNYPDPPATTSPEDEYNGSDLALPWQWNHNPDNRYWSLTDREGWLRLETGHVTTGQATAQFNLTRFEEARNTLSQRTWAPTSSAEVKLDISQMKDGDTTGLAVYNRQLSYVGVRDVDGVRTLGTVNRTVPQGGFQRTTPIAGVEDFLASVPLPAGTDEVWLKADLDLRKPASPTRNTVQFLYSTDGVTWETLGGPYPKMASWEGSHFKGQRFGIFNYATETAGGIVDVDYYALSDTLSSENLPVDTGDLDWLVEEAEGLDATGYTPESWAAVEKALADAQAVESPSTQNQVDAPAQALNRAVAALEELAEPEPPAETSVVVPRVRMTYGRPASMRVQVRGADSGVVSAVVGGRTVQRRVDSSGRATLVLPARSLPPGDRPVRVRYLGTPEFAPSSTVARVSVSRARSRVATAAFRAVERARWYVVRVRVAATGVQPAGKVRLGVAGIGADPVTGALRDGRVTLRVRVAPNASLGAKRVRVTYLGNRYVAPRAVFRTVRVTR